MSTQHYSRPERASSERFSGFVFSRGNHEYLLLGFDINRSDLRPQHRRFLEDVVNEYGLNSANPRAQVDLIEGYTDSVDTREADGNNRLRTLRAQSVAQALIRDLQVAQRSIGNVRGASEGSYLQDNGTPEGRLANRAVLFRIYSISGQTLPPLPQPPPPPPHRDPPPTPPSVTEFGIRMLGEIDIGPFIVITFQIRDYTHNQISYYNFRGLGASRGPQISRGPHIGRAEGPDFNVSTSRPWNRFPIRGSARADQFSGRLDMAGASTGVLPQFGFRPPSLQPRSRNNSDNSVELSRTELTLYGGPNGPIYFRRFQSGTNLLPGVGGCTGVLLLAPRGLFPFPGPVGGE